MANDLVVLRDGIAESGFVTAEVYLSPLPGTEPIRVKARVGSLVRDILPAEARAPMICIIDGVPLKREWWMQRPVCEGDRIQFAPVYLGGKGSRSILGIIAMIAVGVVANWAVGAMFTNTASWGAGLVRAGIMLVGSALVSALLPPVDGGQLGEGDKASSVYSVDTAGNQARVFSPIPVQYGRMKYYPNYASQPYVEYHTYDPGYNPSDNWASDATGTYPMILKSGDTPADWKDGTQYYYALFCLGQGEYEIEQITIADAPISSFGDVLVYRILPPGVKPSYVHPCVVTSDAVSGNSLDKGEYIGPFPVCGPTRKANVIQLDFIFPQGLCKLNDKGKANSHTVKVIIQAARINNLGLQSGEWFTLGDESFTESSLTPQRRTLRYNVEPGRYHVRVCRYGAKDEEDTRTMDSLQWAALRGFLTEDAPLCSTATHFELVMRASEQLSSLSQRKIAIVSTRKLTSWDNTSLEPTRSPARALWDKWTNNVYGDGMPLDRIDVDMLRHYDAVAAERQDRFDYVFENRVSSQEADQTIAKVMRCVALQRQGVKTIVRDELVDMPLTLFNPTNTAEKTVSLEYVQITEETTDGVIAEYFSQWSWDWEEVECPGPGRTYSNSSHEMYDPTLPVMQNPARITLNGITNRYHAEREGLYYAYTNALRRQFITWTTELQGALVYYGAPVLFSSTLYNMLQGGEVRDYNEENGTFSLSNGILSGKIVFMKPDGTVTEPMDFDVTDEEGAWIRLRGNPDTIIDYGSYNAERTKYVIVEGEMIRRIVKILSISPKGIGQSGAPTYELRGVVDVPEVHTVDEFLLGREDEDTPPWVGPDDPPPTPGSESSTDYYVMTRGGMITSKTAVYPNTGYPPSVLYRPDGTTYLQGDMQGYFFSTYFEREWVEKAKRPVDNAGSKFEIMFAAIWDEHTDDPNGTPSGEFLNNPNRELITGYPLRFFWGKHETASDLLASLEISTQEVVKRLYKLGKYNIVHTDWIPMDNEVELKSWWLIKPMTNFRKTCRFAVGIRDKATRTIQWDGREGTAVGLWQMTIESYDYFDVP